MTVEILNYATQERRTITAPTLVQSSEQVSTRTRTSTDAISSRLIRSRMTEIALPVAIWAQIVFAVQESRDARLVALIDQAVAGARLVKAS